MLINWKDFEKIDIRVGEIISAEVFKEAHKAAYIIHVDFGEEIGIRKSSAQITAHYAPADLPGKQIVAVVNFPPKQIGPIKSECLILGVYDAKGDVVLLQPDRTIQKGCKIG